MTPKPKHPGRPRPALTGAFAVKLATKYGTRLAIAYLLAATKRS